MGTAPHRIDAIYDRWVAAGSPLCGHGSRDTVQDMGMPPEEYVCTNCGLTWDRGDPTPESRGNPNT